MSSKIVALLERFAPVLIGSFGGALLAFAVSARSDAGAGAWLLVPAGAIFTWAGNWFIDRLPKSDSLASKQLAPGECESERSLSTGETHPSFSPSTQPSDHVDTVTSSTAPVIVLAGIEDRFWAQLIDALVGVIIGAIAAYQIGWEKFNGMGELSGDDRLKLIGFGIVPLILNAQIFRTSSQTLGKWFMGIKIVRANGAPCDFARWLFLRGAIMYLVSLVPFVGGIAYLVGILMIFRDSRQCLHDQIADTIVVKIP